MHFSWRACIAWPRMVVACSAFHAMTGIMTFSSSCPASAAERIAASQPITWQHTWLTISGTDGLTLPGMIEDPGCTAGKLDFGDARSRPHAQQPQVRRDLGHLDRQPPQRPGVGEHISHALRHPEPVGGGTKRQAGVAREVADRFARVVVAGVEAGADGGCAEVQLVELLGGPFELAGRMKRRSRRSRRTPVRA